VINVIEEIDGFRLVDLVCGKKRRWVDRDGWGLLPNKEPKDFAVSSEPMVYHPSRWDYNEDRPRPGAGNLKEIDERRQATSAATVCERFGLDAEKLGESHLWIRATQATAQLGEEIEQALSEKLKAENAARKANRPTKNSKAAREAARLVWRIDIELLESRRVLTGLRAAKEIAEAFVTAAGIEAGMLERVL
jgi:hypothetical protein